MPSDTIPTRPHMSDSSEQLTVDQARAYLEADGYAAEAFSMMAGALRFPGIFKYTADRHRYVVYVMPAGYWRAGDCMASEERIKALGATRRRS